MAPLAPVHSPLTSTGLCPACRHGVGDLPIAAQCSRCGFEIDPTMRVWLPSRWSLLLAAHRTPWYIWIPTCGLLGALIGLATFELGLWFELGISWIILASIVQSLLMALLLAVLFGPVASMLFPRSRPFVAILERGVVYRLPLGRIRTVGWDELREIREPRGLAVERNAYRTRFDLPCASPRATDEITDAIIERLRERKAKVA